MNNGTKYGIGNNPASQRAKAENITPPIGRILRLDGTHKGCGRNPKRQAKVCSTGNVANGLLRTSFSPMLEETASIANYRNSPTAEDEFWSAFSHVCREHGLDIKPDTSIRYPYNMMDALQKLREQLKEKGRFNWKDIRLMEHEELIFFGKADVFDTGMMLYYIPVEPLYMMLNNRKRKKTADLLLSVFSYLYHIADIPYYRAEETYLFSIYQILRDLRAEDNETEEDFKIADSIGDEVEKHLNDLVHLNGFQKRLLHFSGTDKFDTECYELANRFYSLYVKYPDTPIYRNIRIDEDIEEDDEDEQKIELDRYVSFCASNDGKLFDALFDLVNNELQEICVMREPVIYIPHDGREIKGNDFDFEKRLFTLIEELTSLLGNYKN